MLENPLITRWSIQNSKKAMECCGGKWEKGYVKSTQRKATIQGDTLVSQMHTSSFGNSFSIIFTYGCMLVFLYALFCFLKCWILGVLSFFVLVREVLHILSIKVHVLYNNAVGIWSLSKVWTIILQYSPSCSNIQILPTYFLHKLHVVFALSFFFFPRLPMPQKFQEHVYII